MQKGSAIAKYISSNFWAIQPAYLDTMRSAFTEWTQNAAIEYKTDSAGYTTNITTDGILVLTASGPFHKKLSGLGAMSGGISGENIINQLESAEGNQDIKGIVLALDTPGGTVDGVSSVVKAINQVKLVKPVVTYADGLLASAGVWIGVAASAIVCDEMAQVGSIGVIMIHQEQAKAEADAGIVSTVLTAGQYKGDGNRHEPLSAQAKDNFQASLDYYYSLFVDHVATSRGVTIATCLSTMAEARMFIGQQAKDAGLVDKIGNLETAINLAIELGDENMSAELEKTLATMDANKLLVMLKDNKTLPSAVTEAIVTATTVKEEITVFKVDYDALQASATEAAEQITTLQGTVETLNTQLSEAKEKIKTLEATSATDTVRDGILSQFTAVGYTAEDSVVDTLVALENPQPLIDTILDAHKEKLELAAGLEDSEGLHGDGDDVVVNTRDEAVKQVMSLNPDMDIDDAIKTASKQFPEAMKNAN